MPRTRPIAAALTEDDGQVATVLKRLPENARRLLEQHAVDTPACWAEQDSLGLPRPVRRFIHVGEANLVLEVATNDQGNLRIRREAHGRAWAVANQIPTAALYGYSSRGEWSLGEWVKPHLAAGPEPQWPHWDAYLDSAARVVDLIAAAPAPRSGPAAAVWRSPRRSRLARTIRGAAAGMPMRLWWATRSAVAKLPTVPVSHGDFYSRNVLWHDTSGVCVIDWEYLGEGPQYGDRLRFWSVLPTKSRREAWLNWIMASTPERHHGHIALLALWYSLRRIGENVKAPKAHRNPADTEHAWSVLPEAKALAKSRGVYPL